MRTKRLLTTALLLALVATSAAAEPFSEPAPSSPSRRLPPANTAESQPALTTSQVVSEGSPVPVNSDSFDDQEPVIISNNIGTTTHYLAAYMKFPDRKNQPYNVQIHYSTATHPSSFTPRGELYTGGTGLTTGDPAVAVNPYTIGFNPERVYIVGTRYKHISETNRPNWLSVWHSDNGGTYLGGPFRIDGDDGGRWFYDKPSVAVSWHSGTRGTVYVAAFRADLHNQYLPTLRVYRSREVVGPEIDPNNPGAMKWELMHEEIIGGLAWSPQIVVDSSTGYVYLLWIDRETSQIHLKRSINQGDTFGVARSFRAALYPDNGNRVFLYPIYGSPSLRRICDVTGATCVDAVSALAARYNWASRSIGVVWHGRGDTDNMNNAIYSDNTDVYFNSFSTTSQAWGTVKRVTAVSTNDQWAPALDFDGSGNYLVTYYDRRDDTADIKYNLYATKLTSAGDRITGENDVHVSTEASDPRKYANLGTSSKTLYSLGEYQDVWNWNGKWYAAHVCIPESGTQGDVCVASIAP
jgi:hypothetical protein